MTKLILLLRKIMGKFFDNTQNMYSDTYDSIKQKIDSFPEPTTDYERTKFQYICTMSKWGIGKRIIINIASLFLYLPYYIKLRWTKADDNLGIYDAVYFADNKSIDLIPDVLLNEYSNVLSVNLGEKMLLTKEDVKYLRVIIKNSPFSFYLNFKIMLKLAMNSYYISSCKPKAIISYSEASFTTSVITEYCENNGIQNICIMHGERCYSRKLPFFRCSRYYAWDDDYVNLFKSMRCEETQFRVEVPKAVILPDYKSGQIKYDYTFYLQDENDSSLEILRRIVEVLQKNNRKIAIRPHPGSSFNYNEFPLIEIQSPREVSLADSFSYTKNVVARFSTVLYQAWNLDIPIVIDDITKPEAYEMIRDLDSVLLKKTHKLLSELLEEYDEKIY